MSSLHHAAIYSTCAKCITEPAFRVIVAINKPCDFLLKIRLNHEVSKSRWLNAVEAVMERVVQGGHISVIPSSEVAIKLAE